MKQTKDFATIDIESWQSQSKRVVQGVVGCVGSTIKIFQKFATPPRLFSPPRLIQFQKSTTLPRLLGVPVYLELQSRLSN